MYDVIKSQLASPIHKVAHKLKQSPKSRAAREPGRSSWSAGEKAILAEARRALKAWSDSPEGKTARAALSGQDAEGFRLVFSHLLEGPYFARTRELLAAQPKASDISFPIKSISIGIAGQVDLGVGVYGSIGYAADWDDIKNTSVIYLLGAGTLGLDIGGDIAPFQAGIWKDSTSDMDRFYWGVEVIIDDGAGLAGLGLATDKEGEDLVALLVDLTGGVNDGVDGLLFYSYTFGFTHGPVQQPPQQYLLILNTLQCTDTKALTGHDEINLTFACDTGVNYRYPTWNYYAMSDDSSDPDSKWNLGRSVWYNSYVTVQLWDSGSRVGPSVTFTTEDLPEVGSSKTLPIQQKGDIGNGWVGIDYSLTATRVK
jgi:hypothetical protein